MAVSPAYDNYSHSTSTTEGILRKPLLYSEIRPISTMTAIKLAVIRTPVTLRHSFKASMQLCAKKTTAPENALLTAQRLANDVKKSFKWELSLRSGK